MLGTTYTDLRTGSVLVKALQEGEITLSEFAEAVGFLHSEAAQLLATSLRAYAGTRCSRLVKARAVCSDIAARTRVLS